jgi:hypothetical protein
VPECLAELATNNTKISLNDSGVYTGFLLRAKELARDKVNAFNEWLQGSTAVWCSLAKDTTPTMSKYLTEAEQAHVMASLLLAPKFKENMREKAAAAKEETGEGLSVGRELQQSATTGREAEQSAAVDVGIQEDVAGCGKEAQGDAMGRGNGPGQGSGG